MEEKISYEYELFFLDCMRQSKAGIYARSDEIEVKKQIISFLKEQAGNGSVPEEKIMAHDNILEEAYRYVLDYRQEEKSIRILVETWLKTL